MRLLEQIVLLPKPIFYYDDELLMGKPDYDIYIDDKSFNVDTYWPIITHSKVPS